MIVINKRSPTKICKGLNDITKVMVGNTQIWPNDLDVLKVSVTSITLDSSNNYTFEFTVTSTEDYTLEEVEE
jgi:hypothetical protein